MRILSVNAILDPVQGGGLAERAFQLARYLGGAGAEARVLTTDLGLAPERLAALGAVPATVLPCALKRFQVPRAAPGRIDELVRWADLAHLMGHWGALNPLVAAACRRAGKPWVVCPGGTLPLFGRSRLLKRAFNAFTGKALVREAAGHIAITADEAAQFAPYGVDPARVQVIPNGIAPEDYRSADGAAIRQRLGLAAETPFILFVGRLTGIKGPDLLLEAFGRVMGRLPQHLVLAGPDFGLGPALRERARALGAEARVHFPGFLAGAAKSDAYHAAQLLVIPSRLEAMSIVVLEAGVCGTPVLITDQCGMAEVQTVGGGRVVPATVDGLAAGLLDLLADPGRLPAMGEALRGYTLGRFQWSAVATMHTQYFQRLLAGARA